MPLSTDSTEDLAVNIGAAIKRAIRKNGLSFENAAQQLGISRQSLHAYFAGEAFPGGDILCHACVLWNVAITYNDEYEIRVKRTSGRGAPRRSKSMSSQLELPLTFDIRPRDLAVKVGKKLPHSVHLRLSVSVKP